jgi:hypothetical protein
MCEPPTNENNRKILLYLASGTVQHSRTNLDDLQQRRFMRRGQSVNRQIPWSIVFPMSQQTPVGLGPIRFVEFRSDAAHVESIRFVAFLFLFCKKSTAPTGLPLNKSTNQSIWSVGDDCGDDDQNERM